MDQTNNQERGGGEQGGEGGGRYQRSMRPAFIQIIISDAKQINYKNIEFLRQFVTDSGKLRPRRQTGVSAVQQRRVAAAVKRARHLALLPYIQPIDR
ncbi:MAG: 30S ribosomal protein S18 [Anaerolineales bacterium]